MKSLTVLKLDYNNVTDVGVRFLSQLTNLQCLDLKFNNIGPVGTGYLAQLPNLRVLKLGNSMAPFRLK